MDSEVCVKIRGRKWGVLGGRSGMLLCGQILGIILKGEIAVDFRVIFHGGNVEQSATIRSTSVALHRTEAQASSST